MTRADLSKRISEAIGTTAKEAEMIACTISDSIVRALRSGDKVEIRGFGTFHIRIRKARVGRNPKTGARVDVAPKKVAFFRAAKELRDHLNRI